MFDFCSIFSRSPSVIRYGVALATTIALAGSLDASVANASNRHEADLYPQPSISVVCPDVPVISKIVLADLSGLTILLVVGGAIGSPTRSGGIYPQGSL